MINFSTLQGLTIPEGVVTQIAKDGVVLWALSGGSDTVILEVKKITSDTYAAETLYEGEQFILLDIYPKTNGTVSVTYGGITKTITDTSGVAEPNAQQVVFGTFNGVTHDTTPARGELTIEGDCYAFAVGTYGQSKIIKSGVSCPCITAVKDFGKIEVILSQTFCGMMRPEGNDCELEEIKISARISDIRVGAFIGCVRLVKIVVDGNNKYYSAENGMLFNKDKTHLHSYPVPAAGHFVIPSYVRTVGDNACFINAVSAMTGVTIHADVTAIGSYAFRTTVTGFLVNVLGETPCTMGTDVFSATEDIYPQIIVPKGCGEVYKTAEGWSTYADYIVEAS